MLFPEAIHAFIQGTLQDPIIRHMVETTATAHEYMIPQPTKHMLEESHPGYVGIPSFDTYAQNDKESQLQPHLQPQYTTGMSSQQSQQTQQIPSYIQSATSAYTQMPPSLTTTTQSTVPKLPTLTESHSGYHSNLKEMSKKPSLDPRFQWQTDNMKPHSIRQDEYPKLQAFQPHSPSAIYASQWSMQQQSNLTNSGSITPQQYQQQQQREQKRRKTQTLTQQQSTADKFRNPYFNTPMHGGGSEHLSVPKLPDVFEKENKEFSKQLPSDLNDLTHTIENIVETSVGKAIKNYFENKGIDIGKQMSTVLCVCVFFC